MSVLAWIEKSLQIISAEDTSRRIKALYFQNNLLIVWLLETKKADVRQNLTQIFDYFRIDKQNVRFLQVSNYTWFG